MNHANNNDLYELALQLIRINSENPPGSEKEMSLFIQFIIESQLGIPATLLPINQERYNVIARIGDGEEGLLLNGHLDTVPFGPVNLWHHDALMGTIRDGMLFGRGACDMKGAIAAIIIATKRVLASNMPFNKPLLLAFTADEEDRCRGAQFLLNSHKTVFDGIRYGVIGEPTELQIVRMHKGSLRVRITVKGKAAHSSVPAVGVNAITKASLVIGKLNELAESLLRRTETLGSPTLNVGIISGGSSIFIVPDHCVLEIDRRFLPSEPLQMILDEFKNILEELSIAYELEHEIMGKPLCINPQSLIVQLLENITQSKSASAGYYTEAPLYTAHGIDAILCGPGSIKQAHQPNEFVTIDQLDRAAAIYEELIRKFCL